MIWSAALKESSNTSRLGARPPARKGCPASGGTENNNDAATRLQAVARGRTGRRRSMDAARQRFGYLKQQQPQQQLSSSESRSRSRARGFGGGERKPATLTERVLALVGVEAVMGEVCSSAMALSDEQIARAAAKFKEPGTVRYDMKARVKVRDEKICELQKITTTLDDERKNLAAIAKTVEELLLRQFRVEREKAAATEKALLDGSGLREKLERLEADRDAAVERAAAAEVRATESEAFRREAERVAKELREAVEAAECSRNTALADARCAGEELARERGVGDWSKTTSLELAGEAGRERDAARRELEALRVASAAEKERCMALLQAETEAKRVVAAERDDARERLEAATGALAAATTRAARAEGEAELASRHYEAARDELRLAADRQALDRETREGERRRASAATRERGVERDKLRADAAAWKERAVEAETKARAVEGLEAKVRDLEEAARERDETKTALAALELRCETTTAAVEARLAELRDRAEAADAARDRAAAAAREASAAASAHEARANAAEARARTLEVAADEARRDARAAIVAADGMRAETHAAKHALAVEAVLRNAAQAKEEEERRERTAALAQLLALQDRSATERAATDLELEKTRDEMVAIACVSDAKQRRADADLARAEDLAAKNSAEIDSLRLELEDASESKLAALELSATKGELEALRRRLSAAELNVQKSEDNNRERVLDLESRLRDAETTRRRLHNTIQELRGNVRVFARVRPFLPSDDDGDDDGLPKNSFVQTAADGLSLTLLNSAEDDDDDGPFAKARPREPQHFAFDRVFGPATGQDEIFREVGEFVQSALDGYQVCLFSYGQTGSGKTHTMQGSGRGAMRGIIPRALEQVATYLEEQRERGWEYAMHVTYVEIYNETVRDLLIPANASPETLKKAANLDVRRDAKTGRSAADGATYVPVDPADTQQVDELMTLAAKHRCVAATDMNAVSSRSHAVFTLHLEGVHRQKNARLRGALNLCDLAGSERLARSGAVGLRAKEAAHINKSLSALSGVFSALATKSRHVPYRDSKLTFLLMPALAGNGKTLLMINLSPTPASARESLSTLNFGQKVRKVELGRAAQHLETL
ncbi:hypothetical protein CTAYLR_004909 [Chrysophaeum taylorii]|uniref:Kinesin motor domain-containing protein n=1 Tax=Chrysophaeum taylorii TaxID=2483200 RepID=A0AAD7UQ70_9STRA|nr:hypothetical protein CTAYLR_004909 [Chrysophaeum taylorii]